MNEQVENKAKDENLDNCSDLDFKLLKFILEKNKKNEGFTQREIAEALEISLGMVNNILKKVLKKGFILVSRINSRKINYILSKKGLNIIYNKSVRYFKTLAKNAFLFKKVLCELIGDLKQKNYTKIILIGESSVDFVIEYCCQKNKIEFKQILINNRDKSKDKVLYYLNYNYENTFFFIAESIEYSDFNSIYINSTTDRNKNIKRIDSLFNEISLKERFDEL